MTDLNRQWAQTQVEAFVDGSLSAEAERRMQSVMREVPALREQVERARQLRHELRALRKVRVPGRLALDLMSIPARERAPRFVHMPAAVLAAVGAVAIGVGSFSIVERQWAQTRAREAAVRDFEVAMVYLQRSTALANSEMAEAVGLGVRSAMNTSRDALEEAQGGLRQGDSNDVD